MSILEPKKTLVGLAGQKAWHNCAGEAAPRISGKYLPSQLRTQNAGPALATTGRGGGDCGLLLKGLPRDGACCCCFWPPPKNKSSNPWAALISGVSATGPTMVTTTSMRRSLRRKDNSVRIACSPGLRARSVLIAAIVDAKRALSWADKGREIGELARQ